MNWDDNLTAIIWVAAMAIAIWSFAAGYVLHWYVVEREKIYGKPSKCNITYKTFKQSITNNLNKICHKAEVRQ